MDETEKPLDAAPGALYRTLPRDEPPPAIDKAVLAAARKSVAMPSGRKWAAPVALAAVLLLSVGVTLRVSDERPDAQLQPVSPPSASSPASTATGPVAKGTDAAAPVSAPAPHDNAPTRQTTARPGPAKRETVTPLAEERARSAARAEERPGPSSAVPRMEAAPAPVAPPAIAPPAGFVPSPRADSAQPAPPGGPSSAGSVGPPAASAERSAARSAAQSVPSTQSDSGPPMMAKSVAVESNLGAAVAQSPEGWLKQIAAMRAQGRDKEADESYEEFRRRYPGYAIAPEMLRSIGRAR